MRQDRVTQNLLWPPGAEVVPSSFDGEVCDLTCEVSPGFVVNTKQQDLCSDVSSDMCTVMILGNMQIDMRFI